MNTGNPARICCVIFIMVFVCVCASSSLPEKKAATDVAHPATKWTRKVGGPGNSSGVFAIQTADGGYFLMGSTRNNQGFKPFMWAAKFDFAGTQKWLVKYKDGHDEEASSAYQTDDGGYIVTGTEERQNKEGDFEYNAIVMKLDSRGKKQWKKAFNLGVQGSSNSVLQSSDGGYVVAGTSPRIHNADTYFRVFKLNRVGKKIWDVTYGNGFDAVNDICRAGDGGYIAVGNSVSKDGTLAVVMKLDAAGSKSWENTFKKGIEDAASAVRRTSDGGFIVLSNSRSGVTGITDVLVLKLDASGGTQWKKTIHHETDTSAGDIQQTSDGGYIVAGTLVTGCSEQNCAEDAIAVKLDSQGEKMWERTYSSDWNENFLSVEQTRDGGYIVSGIADFSMGTTDSYAWLLKLDPSGDTGLPRPQ